MQEFINSLNPWLAAAILTVVIALESGVIVGMVLPGSSVLLMAGALIAADVLSWWVLLPLWLASLAGILAAHHDGKANGQKIRNSKFGRWIGESKWEKAEEFFTNKKSSALFVGQFIVVIRSLMPRLAGMNGTLLPKILPIVVPATALWAAGIPAVVAVLGTQLAAVADQAQAALPGLGVIVLAVLGVLYASKIIALSPMPSRWFAGKLNRDTRLGRWLHDRGFAGSDRPPAKWLVLLSTLAVVAVLIVLVRLIRYAMLFIFAELDMDAVDQAIERNFDTHRSQEMSGILLGLMSTLFNGGFIMIGILAIAAVVWFRSRRNPDRYTSVWNTLNAFGLFLPAFILLQGVRPEQEDYLLHPERHMFGAQTALVVYLAIILWWKATQARRPWLSAVAVAFAGLAVVFIMYARVYTGVDVLSSVLTQAVVAAVCAFFIIRAGNLVASSSPTHL